jgi:preprotein translocase subunit SecG
MQVLLNVVLGLQMLSAIVMIGVVLLQHGKGADMGASFGTGSAGSLFGASGSANFLSRSTAVAATVFFCCTLALAYFNNLHGRTQQQQQPAGQGVLEQMAAPAVAASAASGVPAAVPASGAASPAAAVPASAPASKAPAIPSK